MNVTNDKFQSLNLLYLIPLCNYVKTLHFTWPSDITNLSALLDCSEQSELHTLVVDSWELSGLGRQSIRQCFVKFPCLLITTLELLDIHPRSVTPLILLSLFPNVDNLAISAYPWWHALFLASEDDGETTQAPSLPRFRGSFRFFDPPSNPWYYQQDILHAIATSTLQFQTVSLVVKSQSWEDNLNLLISCSKAAREVSVVFSARNPCKYLPWISYHPTCLARKDIPDIPVANRLPINFTSLVELRIMIRDAGDHVSQDGYSVHSLLKLVMSPCLQRVVVRAGDRSVLLEASVGWALLDESLANLVERCKAYGNLTPLIVMEAYPQHVRELFPRISRLGVLEVL